MSEKEYAVIVHRGVNLQEVEEDLKRSTGSGPIPNRSVDVANERRGSKRMTHFALTDEEAKQLENDPRIMAVEIPPYLRDDIIIGRRATQSGIFSKANAVDNTVLNWGLRRCIETTNVFGANTTLSTDYRFAVDGTGVDIVIQDSGVEPNHPDWNDYDGNSRYRFQNWYTVSGLAGTQNANHDRDFDGHGTACASVSAGLLYGWAKGARIYSQKVSGLEGPNDSGTGLPIADLFDSVRLWHENKAVDPITGYKRPTVINASWGYYFEANGDPTSGNYRGTSWTWGVDYTTDAALWAATGVVPPYSGSTRRFNAPNAFADAEVQDLIDSGVHFVVAAGNEYYKMVDSSDTDWNNTVIIGGSTYNYHRGGSPYDDEAFCVGSIATTTQSSGGNDLDKIANYSNRGPKVNIFAPGDNIACAVSNSSIYSQTTYPNNASYYITNIDGTSFAAPQVAGVVAQHLQVRPDLTPAQMRSRIINDSYNVIYETGNTDDYNAFSTTLLGAPNRMLYSKYGKQPFTTNGSVNYNAGFSGTNRADV